ncbi:MAG TPA: DUF1499 domain-containing protein, partial [Rhizomicrobium sp.]
MRLLPWLAKLSFAAFVLALLAGGIAGFGTRLEFWDLSIGLFRIFPWCAGCALLGFVVGLAWLVWAIVANRGSAARYGLVGLLGSAAVIAPTAYDIYRAKNTPRIHDISTDTDHAPVFVALKYQRNDAQTPASYDGPSLGQGPDGKTATTAALQRKYYPSIFSKADLTAPDKLFDRALKTAYRMGWHVVAVAPKEGRIEATETSLLFGITDDIVIRVKPAGMGARLDIRSKSRTPIWRGSDIGENAARIRSYLKTLSSTY